VSTLRVVTPPGHSAVVGRGWLAELVPPEQAVSTSAEAAMATVAALTVRFI
jgi:hypothetical protein